MGTYIDTSGIVDSTSIEAADVKAPLDALDETFVDFRDGDNAFNQLNLLSTATATIASDAITVTTSFVTIDTEGGAATDDLSTINGAAGDLLVLRIANAARVITVKNGVGNIFTPTGRDIRLSSATQILTLYRISGWLVLIAPPPVEGARVRNSTTTALTTGIATALSFDTELFDVDAIHSTSSNQTRLTCNTGGVYKIGASVGFAANATGARQLQIRLNGTTIIDQDSRGGFATTDCFVNVETEYLLVPGDYVEVLALQTSGGNLNVQSVGNSTPEFWMQRVA